MTSWAVTSVLFPFWWCQSSKRQVLMCAFLFSYLYCALYCTHLLLFSSSFTLFPPLLYNTYYLFSHVKGQYVINGHLFILQTNRGQRSDPDSAIRACVNVALFLFCFVLFLPTLPLCSLLPRTSEQAWCGCLTWSIRIRNEVDIITRAKKEKNWRELSKKVERFSIRNAQSARRPGAVPFLWAAAADARISLGTF